MSRLISSLSDPKKVTVMAVLAYLVCTAIAAALMTQTGDWAARWFAPGVLAFGAIAALYASWRGKKRTELAAMWPVCLGLLSGLLIEIGDLITSQDHAVPYIAGLAVFSLMLAFLRVEFLRKQLKS